MKIEDQQHGNTIVCVALHKLKKHAANKLGACFLPFKNGYLLRLRFRKNVGISSVSSNCCVSEDLGSGT